MRDVVLCGMQFGDEGKGSLTDYLAHAVGAKCTVRYNGGSQASHTVVTPEGLTHRFAQLGSGSFLPGCGTMITDNTVVNPDNLIVETGVFSRLTGVSVPDLMRRVRIHRDCLTVTPYHKLLNRMRECSLGSGRRGSVGTGVSEAKRLEAECGELYSVYVRDVIGGGEDRLYEKLCALRELAADFPFDTGSGLPADVAAALEKERAFLLRPDAPAILFADMCNKFRTPNGGVYFPNSVYGPDEAADAIASPAVFEGAQGLLIDGARGLLPNTTCLDTSARYAYTLRDDLLKLGAVKAFLSRHGPGVFPTESAEVSSRVRDKNQESTFWNGAMRFGWFDAVLLRYAQRINGVEALCVSALDQLDAFDTLRVCVGYRYSGPVDAEFHGMFDSVPAPGGERYIRELIKSGTQVSRYLMGCTPVYETVPGWQTPTGACEKAADLPPQCRRYLDLIERQTGLPVALVSVGPARNRKLRLADRNGM